MGKINTSENAVNIEPGNEQNKERYKEKRRTRLPKVRRNRKLLVHVGLIIGVIFLIVIGVTAVILVKENIRTYLKSKEEYMRPLADRQLINILNSPNIGWFIDRWEADHSLAYLYVDKDMENPYYQELVQVIPYDEENARPGYDPDHLDDLPPRIQDLLAGYLYTDIYMEQMLSCVLMQNLSCLEVDVSEEHWGTGLIYMGDLYLEEQDLDEYSTGLGDDYSYILNEMEGIKKVKETGSSTFERFESPRDGSYYYTFITPIFDKGEVRAVQILIYDWSNYHSTVIKNALWIVGISTLVLALAAVLLLYFINRSAIRPLGKVQRGVRDYMVTKDSWRVYEQLKDIKQRNEFGALADDVTQMAVEIDRYTEEVKNLTKDRERVEAELSLAADIQKGFLPGEFPEAADYEIYASMNPAKEVGGDLYDFFDIDPTHVGLVIGDVSGKGVPASLFMMIAKVLIREYARTGASPSEVLARANQTLCANNKNDMFVTAWFGILDRTTGKILAASAGHEFPIMHSAEGGFTLVKDRHGFVLGGIEMTKYREYELELGKGGILLVYTDGAPEATNANDELFGTDRMLEALNSSPCEHPREVIDTIDRAISEFVKDAPQFDDLTMLCVRYKGQ